MAGGLWALGVDTALRHSDQLPEKGCGGTRKRVWWDKSAVWTWGLKSPMDTDIPVGPGP